MESDTSAFREEVRELSSESPTKADGDLKLIAAVILTFESYNRPSDAQKKNFDNNTTLIKNPDPTNIPGPAKTKHNKTRTRLRAIHEEFGRDAFTAHCLGFSKTRIQTISSFSEYKILFKTWWDGFQKPESFLSWSRLQDLAISTPGKPLTSKRPSEEVDKQPAKRVDTGNQHLPNDAETHMQSQKETVTDSIDNPNRQSPRAGVFWAGDMSNAPSLGGAYRVGRQQAIIALVLAPEELEGTLIFPNEPDMKPFIMMPLPEITALATAGNSQLI